jgi:alkylation response protein AidB-like acyl-CoA dehydrogenase
MIAGKMAEKLEQLQIALQMVSQKAEEIERARGFSQDIVEALAQARCFRMFAPKAYAGDEVELTEALKIIELLAEVDGSTGWNVAQVCLAQLIFSLFSEETVGILYGGGPDLYGAGAVAPKGRARLVDGSWIVVGQWPFITGCNLASWFYLNCIVLDGHSPKLLPNGFPETRMMLFPANEVQILDTWRSVGLRGTGSHDVRVHQIRCSDEYTYAPSKDADGGSRATLAIAQSGLLIAAVALGIAQGAVKDASALAAAGKRPAFASGKLAEIPQFQEMIGEAYMNLYTSRTLLHKVADDAFCALTLNQTRAPLDRAVLRATAAQVISMACGAADIAYKLGGGTSVYESSPLQRRFRDIHTATQHFVAGREFYGVIGAILAGAKVDATLF